MKPNPLTYLIFILILLCSQSLSAQIKVACIGNSITRGHGLSSPATQSYPARLQEILGSNYTVFNYGASGSTLLRNTNNPYIYTNEYNQALQWNPDMVLIMLGTNDAKLHENWLPQGFAFKTDYKAMIRSFQALRSNPKIWLCQIVPSYQTDGEILDSIINHEINPQIREVAWEEGLHLIDLYAVLEHKENMYQPDGLHPDSIGALKMARYISALLGQDTLQIQREDFTLQAPEAVAYQWYINGEAISEASGGCASHFEAYSSGMYHVGLRLSDSTQSILNSAVVAIERPDIIQVSKLDDTHLTVYPNPCQNWLSVRFNHPPRQMHEFQIFTMDGRLVYSQKIESGEKKALINTQ